ncbi:diphosphomevalonate decarboxylase [Thermoflexus sp.]|uniref:diphosphomevalonate decarboxylase n=1 Tax=Thermoflexus sp. TaxID=1969742 RepID=UPI0017761739|nr:diphosphomevalonate decarboxylase [Thermoflexus sp.]
MEAARRATAQAHPNIAFIKYWGNRDDRLRLPANPSLSMNLGALRTVTTVTFLEEEGPDVLILNGIRVEGPARDRVEAFLNHVRGMAGLRGQAVVESSTDIPAGVGLASSAAAFAALAVAAAAALGLDLSERELSILARLGSGSACRSVPPGFVEWVAGDRHEDSYAYSIAPPEHWALWDVIAIVSEQHKAVSSSEGHRRAATSPLHALRVATASERVARCREAIQQRDFESLVEIVETDAIWMHAVMMTSRPPLFYWEPATITVLQAVRRWREEGLPVAFTLDAGPNVHVLCPGEVAPEVAQRLERVPGVRRVLTSGPGGGASRIPGS